MLDTMLFLHSYGNLVAFLFSYSNAPHVGTSQIITVAFLISHN